MPGEACMLMGSRAALYLDGTKRPFRVGSGWNRVRNVGRADEFQLIGSGASRLTAVDDIDDTVV